MATPTSASAKAKKAAVFSEKLSYRLQEQQQRRAGNTVRRTDPGGVVPSGMEMSVGEEPGGIAPPKRSPTMLTRRVQQRLASGGGGGGTMQPPTPTRKDNNIMMNENNHDKMKDVGPSPPVIVPSDPSPKQGGVPTGISSRHGQPPTQILAPTPRRVSYSKATKMSIFGGGQEVAVSLDPPMGTSHIGRHAGIMTLANGRHEISVDGSERGEKKKKNTIMMPTQHDQMVPTKLSVAPSPMSAATEHMGNHASGAHRLSSTRAVYNGIQQQDGPTHGAVPPVATVYNNNLAEEKAGSHYALVHHHQQQRPGRLHIHQYQDDGKEVVEESLQWLKSPVSETDGYSFDKPPPPPTTAGGSPTKSPSKSKRFQSRVGDIRRAMTPERRRAKSVERKTKGSRHNRRRSTGGEEAERAASSSQASSNNSQEEDGQESSRKGGFLTKIFRRKKGTDVSVGTTLESEFPASTHNNQNEMITNGVKQGYGQISMPHKAVAKEGQEADRNIVQRPEEDRPEVFFANDDISTLTGPTVTRTGKSDNAVTLSDPIGHYWVNTFGKNTSGGDVPMSYGVSTGSPTNDPFSFQEPDGQSPNDDKAPSGSRLQENTMGFNDPVGESPHNASNNVVRQGHPHIGSSEDLTESPSPRGHGQSMIGARPTADATLYSSDSPHHATVDPQTSDEWFKEAEELADSVQPTAPSPPPPPPSPVTHSRRQRRYHKTASQESHVRPDREEPDTSVLAATHAVNSKKVDNSGPSGDLHSKKAADQTMKQFMVDHNSGKKNQDENASVAHPSLTNQRGTTSTATVRFISIASIDEDSTLNDSPANIKTTEEKPALTHGTQPPTEVKPARRVGRLHFRPFYKPKTALPVPLVPPNENLNHLLQNKWGDGLKMAPSPKLTKQEYEGGNSEAAAQKEDTASNQNTHMTISGAARVNAEAVAYIHTLNNEPSPRNIWNRVGLSEDEDSPKVGFSMVTKILPSPTLVQEDNSSRLFAAYSSKFEGRKPSRSHFNKPPTPLSAEPSPKTFREDSDAVKVFSAYSGKFKGRKPPHKSAPGENKQLQLCNKKDKALGSIDIGSSKTVALGIAMLKKKRDDDVASGRAVRVVPTKTLQVPEVRSYFGPDLSQEPRDPIQRAGRRLLSKAAIPIQTAVRRFLAQREAIDRMWALIEIQSYLRRWRYEASFLANKSSAIAVQRVFRGSRVRESLVELNSAAVCIQKIARGYLAAAHTYDAVYGIILIQARARGNSERDALRQCHSSATKLQSIIRGAKGRSSASQRLRAITKIQAQWRCFTEMLLYRFDIIDIIIAQGAARQWLSRRRLDEARQRVAAVKIQAVWRGFQGYTDYIFCLVDVMLVQRVVRAWLAKKKANTFRQELAAVKIQSQWRRYRDSIKMLLDFVHVIQVQSVVRRYLAGSKIQLRKMEIEEKNQAATIIQSTWRGFVGFSIALIRDYEIVRMQAIFRGEIARREFILKLGCCMMIQCAVRRFLAIKKARRMQIEHTVTLSGSQAMRESRACSDIQFWWRLVLDCEREKKAALVIERFFLMVKAEVDREIWRVERQERDNEQKRKNEEQEKAWLNNHRVDENHVDVFAFSTSDYQQTAAKNRRYSSPRTDLGLIASECKKHDEQKKDSRAVRHRASSPPMNLVMRHDFDQTQQDCESLVFSGSEAESSPRLTCLSDSSGEGSPGKRLKRPQTLEEVFKHAEALMAKEMDSVRAKYFKKGGVKTQPSQSTHAHHFFADDVDSPSSPVTGRRGRKSTGSVPRAKTMGQVQKSAETVSPRHARIRGIQSSARTGKREKEDDTEGEHVYSKHFGMI